MKVFQIDPSLFTWPYDQALIDGLRRNGHEVTLVTKHLIKGEPGKGEPFVREFFYPCFQTKTVKSLPRPVFLGLKGVAHLFGLIRLFIMLKKAKPDVIHFQWAPLPVMDRHFINMFKKIAPVILTVHDSSPFNNNPSARLQRIGSITIMERFDRLIVHTKQAQERLAQYGLDPARIARIPHGALGEPIKAGAVKEETLKSRRPLTLLLFGQLKPYKGADIAIRALADLPEDLREKCRLRIAGKAMMDVEPLKKLAADLGVEKYVVWDLRFIKDEELPQLFADTDITIMPYREIDASGVLMLSLSVGRPIIASRIGLFAEMLEDGKHGFLTPKEDVKAFAAAIENLVKDDALRVDLGRNVQALGASIPSWEKIAEKTSALYENALREKA